MSKQKKLGKESCLAWGGGRGEGKMSSMENACLVRKHAERRTAEAKQWQLGCKG